MLINLGNIVWMNVDSPNQSIKIRKLVKPDSNNLRPTEEGIYISFSFPTDI
jgi:hypothetical protein